MQSNPLAAYPRTIVTTYHDFEGGYGMPGMTERSLKAMERIVEIERRHGVRSTYNTVALYAREIPELMRALVADGHEIASHSYDHSVLAGRPSCDQLNNIRAAGAVFAELGIAVRGHRSPLSRWDRRLMRHLCSEGYAWTAENGGEPHPYVVHRGRRGALWRFPVAADDWGYQADRLTPARMLAGWQATVNAARATGRYTAIGFHPWVECDDGRLDALEAYLAWLKSLDDVEVLPFGAVLDLVRSRVSS